VQVAKKANFPLKVVNIEDANARALYEHGLVLVRPDQHICWRGDELPVDLTDLINTVTGKL